MFPSSRPPLRPVGHLGLPAVASALAVLLITGAVSVSQGQAPSPGWVRVDYADLVDLRQLSHSGESIEILLRKLEGRPLPPAGERPADRLTHLLLDPLLEPYAFVLSDALDAIGPAPEPPLVEIGSLWHPGESQPAWVELLRARRYVLESDGRGKLRLLAPWDATTLETDAGLPAGASAEAAHAAWSEAWPVLRHALAAERRRLAGEGEAPPLEVAVHAYRHRPARLEFHLGLVPHRVRVVDTAAAVSRPPLDLEAFRRLAVRGFPLEGARLGADGSLRLLTEFAAEPARAASPTPTAPVSAAERSHAERERDRSGAEVRGKRKRRRARRAPEPRPGTPTAAATSAAGDREPGGGGLLGGPLTLADLAVAYRAVFHGGLTEPYMSLDRGDSPQFNLVNYGGRLRDTHLGWVSLLCDMRFKTFYLGLGFLEGRDLREDVRRSVADFRSHLERFATDPRSRGVLSEQIRFWFYPDDVDLTVSLQGDVLVLRRVRMTATSERVREELLPGEGREDPPWTRATIAEINADYDALAGRFPELGDLDRVVRLLSFFTWLRQARDDGLPVPDLDVLLDLELPPAATPRALPQLLSFNALPPPDGAGWVEAIDRVPVAEALERLRPPAGRLPARQRFDRALGALDPRLPDHRALHAELSALDSSALTDSVLDLLAYRAERLRMHRELLTSLPDEDRRRLAARERAGERLRVFSVGIGGIDLGMQQALDRARGSSRRLAWGTSTVPSAASASPSPAASTARPAPTRRATSSGVDRGGASVVPPSTMPVHPNGRSGFTLAVEDGPAPGGSSVRLLYGADGPEARARKVESDSKGRAVAFERTEADRRLRYGFVRDGDGMRARRPTEAGTPVAQSRPAIGEVVLPDRLVLLSVAASLQPEAEAVRLVIVKDIGGTVRELETDVDRSKLERLVLGRTAAAPRRDPLEGIFPLPEAFGPVRAVMVLTPPSLRAPPWSAGGVPAPGERHPVRVADALRRWWSVATEPGGYAAVVGTDLGSSPARWRDAPDAPERATLLLPEDAFPPPFEELRARLAAAWPAGRVATSLPSEPLDGMVALIGAEPAGPFADRLRRLARAPEMQGRLLAAWNVLAPVRDDLPASLLQEGRLAGIGLAGASVPGLRGAESELSAWAQAIRDSAKRGARVEQIAGPFLWFF